MYGAVVWLADVVAVWVAGGKFTLSAGGLMWLVPGGVCGSDKCVWLHSGEDGRGGLSGLVLRESPSKMRRSSS